MAKAKSAHRPPPTKKQLHRRRREQRQLRWLWTGVGVIAVAVVSLLAWAFISQTAQVVATVNGQPIRIAEYQQRLRFWYHYYNDYLIPGSFDNLQPEQRDQFYQEMVDQLVREKLVQQEAQKNNLSVSNEEIQIKIEEGWFQHYRTPLTPTPSPTPNPQATPTAEATPLPTPTPDTEEAFQANYQQFVQVVLQPAGVNEAYFRHIVEASLLEEKLKMALVPDVPTEEDQVHFRYTTARDDEDARAKIASYQSGVADQVHAQHILVATQEEAEAVLERLKAGEDFAALAAELSTDTATKDEGGDLGWFARGKMDPAFAEAAFGADIGLYPVPVETQLGYHVINVLAHEEHPVDVDSELFDAGWYGKDQLSKQFGPLFAAMVFDVDVGLVPDPVPTDYGVAVVELLDHQVRSLDAQEQETRRSQLFEDQLTQIQQQANVQNLWESSMVPTKL